MHNSSVNDELDRCEEELKEIQTIIASLGLTSSINPFLSRYAVIRACGAVETAFKTLIADYVSHSGTSQIRTFLRKRIREGSANPNFGNMCKFLRDFDEEWKDSFKEAVNLDPNKPALLSSLQSLVDARNEFAHGGSPIVSIADVIRYFSDSRTIISMMDRVIGLAS